MAAAAALTSSVVLCGALPSLPSVELRADEHRVFRTGDIVFVRGRSWRSHVVRLLDRDNGDFSHVGLVRVEQGAPYVIHATPTPSEGSKAGSVRREELSDFLSSDRIAQAGLFRLRQDPGGVAEAAASVAHAFATRGAPFDHKFDLSMAEALYCTELVWRAYRQVGVELVDTGPDGKTILLPSALRESVYLEEIARF